MQAKQEILVIAATDLELAPARELLGESPAGISFAATGAGKVSTALKTLELIQQRTPGWIIQVGCAGAYPSSGLSTGDAALAELEIFADEGVRTPDGFLTMEDLSLPQAEREGEVIYNRVPVEGPTKTALESIRSAIAAPPSIRTGPFCTVSCGSGSDAAAAWIEAAWSPLVESMEGASAALVAWKHKVRFSEIRGISNQTGNRKREEWDIPAACESAARVLAAWIAAERGSP